MRAVRGGGGGWGEGRRPILRLDQGNSTELGAGAGDETPAEGRCLDLVHLEDGLLLHLV